MWLAAARTADLLFGDQGDVGLWLGSLHLSGSTQTLAALVAVHRSQPTTPVMNLAAAFAVVHVQTNVLLHKLIHQLEQPKVLLPEWTRRT